jgi:hypothetical protein
MREDFAPIPVIDLKDGGVVHARAGKRADYRPLETPFGLADDPLPDSINALTFAWAAAQASSRARSRISRSSGSRIRLNFEIMIVLRCQSHCGAA